MKIAGTVRHNKEDRIVEAFEEDPFEKLLTENQASIGATVGRSTDFGNEKCAFTVTIKCPQDRASMNLAAQIAFETALEYTNDAMSHIAPHLERLGGPSRKAE